MTNTKATAAAVKIDAAPEATAANPVPAKPRTPQYSWMNEPVPQAWIDKDPDYFTRLDNQVKMIKDAAVANGWNIASLSDRDIHVQVWRTRSDESAVKKLAAFLGVELPKPEKAEESEEVAPEA